MFETEHIIKLDWMALPPLEIPKHLIQEESSEVWKTQHTREHCAYWEAQYRCQKHYNKRREIKQRIRPKKELPNRALSFPFISALSPGPPGHKMLSGSLHSTQPTELCQPLLLQGVCRLCCLDAASISWLWLKVAIWYWFHPFLSLNL